MCKFVQAILAEEEGVQDLWVLKLSPFNFL